MMSSIDDLERNLLDRYHVRIVSKSRKQRKYVIDDSEIIQGLFSLQEKEKCKWIEQQLLQNMGYIPKDEYINIGKRIEIIVYLYKDFQPKQFEISPICDLLFEQLIVMFGYDDFDKEKGTSRYKRYVAAQKYLNTHNSV